MVSKNRQGKHKPKKLNLDSAEKIRDLYNTGNYTQKQLGIMFGVTQNMISKITLNQWWRNNVQA